MEEEPKNEEQSTTEPEDNQPEAPEPEQRRKFRLHFKKLPRPLVIGVLAVVFVGLLAGCFLLYKKSNDLSHQNKSLSSTIAGYKKANAKPTKLTDLALKPVTSDTKAQTAPAPADNGSYGGTAVQVNTANPDDATPKYDGGEYAPYWLLTNYALSVPDGVKMVRTTDVATDGHLLTDDNEGSAGCGGEGIYMTVTSTLTVPGNAMRAWGSSATYKRGVGCNGADPITAVYAKYYPMAQASQYKYMELVTADCASYDANYNCAGGVDKTKWRLYSGIVLADATEYKAGDALQGGDLERQLYNRDSNGAQFYIDCSTEQWGGFNCNANDYKNKDYNAALQDSSYAQLKNIILNMHTY